MRAERETAGEARGRENERAWMDGAEAERAGVCERGCVRVCMCVCVCVCVRARARARVAGCASVWGAHRRAGAVTWAR